MRKTMVICDCCKEEITGGPVKIVTEVTDLTGTVSVRDGLVQELAGMDFHQECAAKLIGDLLGRLDPDAPPEKAKKVKKGKPGTAGKPEVEKPAKNKIDAGMVMALHKAGRSVKWIADDMGCSDQTVYNILKKEGKPGAEDTAT